MNRQQLARLIVAIFVVGAFIAPAIWRATRPVVRTASPPAPVATATSSCAPVSPAAAPDSPRNLVDVTSEVGIEFRPATGPLGTFYLPEANGAGGAFLDFDGDGDLDVLLVNSRRSPQASGDFPPGTTAGNRLYRREGDGHYVDVTDESGLADAGYGVGCAVGDIDNDGDVDVYISAVGGDRLFQNEGAGHFVEITRSAGITNAGYATSAAFCDYDRDGWLDLVVVNYVDDPWHGYSVGCGFADGRVSYCGPLKFVPTIDRLYHNEGAASDESGRKQASFRDVTEESGFSGEVSAGFGVVCADFTRDGWPDIFIASDAMANRLWVNQQNGTFRDESLVRGAAFSGGGRPQAGMGVTTADFDDDGDFDILITHLTTEYATLYDNDGTGMFTDVSQRAGLVAPTRKHTGWGVSAVDLDHDGHLDVTIANGMVVPCGLNFPPHGEEEFQERKGSISDADAFWRDYADFNVVLLNSGAGKFTEASHLGGDFAGATGSARALASGDFDDDGDIDFLVTYCGQPVRLYRNEFPKRGHWLLVRAVDAALKRDAYGAEVTVRAGARTWRRLAHPASSFLTSNDPRVHYGLGDLQRYDAIEVLWPDGLLETFQGGAADTLVTLIRGTGEPLERTLP